MNQYEPTQELQSQPQEGGQQPQSPPQPQEQGNQDSPAPATPERTETGETRSGSKLDVIFGGFGGQGIVLSGYITGKAASIFDNKSSVLSQSYGPEARGGACSANIVVSDREIDYPYITSADLLVVMSQEAYTNYLPKLKKGGTLIYDEVLVKLEGEPVEGITYHSIPATRLAEEIGKRIISNIVMLGFVTAKTGLVSEDAMKKAILSSVPKGTEELNEKAFMRGLEYGRSGA